MAARADQVLEHLARAMVEPLAAQLRAAALQAQRSQRGDPQGRGGRGRRSRFRPTCGNEARRRRRRRDAAVTSTRRPSSQRSRPVSGRPRSRMAAVMQRLAQRPALRADNTRIAAALPPVVVQGRNSLAAAGSCATTGARLIDHDDRVGQAVERRSRRRADSSTASARARHRSVPVSCHAITWDVDGRAQSGPTAPRRSPV